MTYQCKCVKCGSDYESQNEWDTDGFGRCLSCAEEKRKIAEEINAKAAMAPSRPKKRSFDDLPRIPGSKYIDYKTIKSL